MPQVPVVRRIYNKSVMPESSLIPLFYWGGFLAVYRWKHFSVSVYTEFATPDKNLTTVDILFTTKAGVGWVEHSAYITGWPILLILIIIVICSLPFVRRGGHFQVSVHRFIFLY